MSSLFLLSQEYRAIADKLSDLDLPPQTVRDTLEACSGPLEEKAQGWAHVILNLRASAAAIKAHAESQLARAKAEERQAEHMEASLSAVLQANNLLKISGPSVVISFRKSQTTEISDPALLPAQFWSVPVLPDPKPLKVEIKAAIKLGEIVPGAYIADHLSLQIK